MSLRALAAAFASAVLVAGPATELTLGPGTAPAGKHKNGKVRHGKSGLVASDTGSSASPYGFWGDVECASDQRHQLIASGGDQHPTVTGEAQGNDSFRRLSVFDGDDHWGERCQLGDDNSKGRATFYREGQHVITQVSARLPTEGPLALDAWQVVLQMKQAGPAANSGGTPVLSLDAYDGRWRFRQSDSVRAAEDSHELWSAPATAGRWTRFSFDVRYSRRPSKGFVSVSADLNADGDFLDPGETSPRIRTYTLKVELPGGSPDGIRPGQSIPSHLSAGVYHDPEIPCPQGCYVDLDNVQVLRVRP
jgi:hypothetical protein